MNWENERKIVLTEIRTLIEQNTELINMTTEEQRKEFRKIKEQACKNLEGQYNPESSVRPTYLKVIRIWNEIQGEQK